MGKVIPFQRPAKSKKGPMVELSVITDEHLRLGSMEGSEPIALVIRGHAGVCMSVETAELLILGIKAAPKEHGAT